MLVYVHEDEPLAKVEVSLSLKASYSLKPTDIYFMRRRLDSLQCPNFTLTRPVRIDDGYEFVPYSVSTLRLCYIAYRILHHTG